MFLLRTGDTEDGLMLRLNWFASLVEKSRTGNLLPIVLGDTPLMLMEIAKDLLRLATLSNLSVKHVNSDDLVFITLH